jgi:hypothetical protein
VHTTLVRIGLVVAVSAAFATAASGSTAADPAVPSIYVNYHVDCTFTITVEGGTTVTASSPPGPTIPPGPYVFQVFMPNPPEGTYGRLCEMPRFRFSGPGAGGQIEFDGEELHDDTLRPVLQPSSTYVAEDANAPTQTRKVFTTAASGSSSALLGPAAPPSSGGKGDAHTELVGSAILRYRGRLAATVGAAGKATLTRGGRSVVSLKAGRYDIRVDDPTARAGFFVQRGKFKPVTVSSPAFVGQKTQRIALRAGKWTYFSKAGTPPTPFNVVA